MAAVVQTVSSNQPGANLALGDAVWLLQLFVVALGCRLRRLPSRLLISLKCFSVFVVCCMRGQL